MKKNKSMLFADFSTDILKKRKKVRQPSFVQPMLATLTEEYFSSDDWIYEHKFDGERCIVVKKNGKVHLMSRNQREINQEYPELAKAFIEQKSDNFIVDGEIVAIIKGISNFELLQQRINVQSASKAMEKKIPIFFHIFDVMYVDGYDICALPLKARKIILERLLHYNKMLLLTEYHIGNGIKLFKRACKLGWEGLMAKRFESPYVHVRSKDWLKIKCVVGQELVIGGYTEPKGSRKYFGALLVGYYDKQGNLRYAGKVGTGFSDDTLTMLGKKLQRLIRKTCPFFDYDLSTRGVHWVKPSLVAEFKFAQWTKSGKLRVGRYKGLRTDKAAKDVVKEVPS